MALQPATARRLEPQNRIGGKYRLRRRIAVGGMGEIWVARNEATDANVALKVLRPESSEKTNQAAARFRNEARLAAMLTHRSIIRIFDLVEEDDQTLLLVMELLRGETLQVYLERKGPRPSKEAVAVLTPILSALHHAHEVGVVHRDVTPSNIFLNVDPDGHVTPKLVDFGIAKLPGPPRSGPKASAIQPVQTLEGRVLGTPRYMSPEQIRSQEVDGRSDLFSLAVVLYEMMTGVQPFAASTPSASLAAVLEAQVDPDPRIEPRLWFEIQRALAKRPYERHATAQEMAGALREAIGETEGSLDATLKRTRPPAPASEEAAEAEPMRSPTPTIEGQSMALALPGRRFGWAPWVGAGLLVGLLGVAALATLRTTTPPAPAASLASTSAAAHVPPPAPPSATASATPTTADTEPAPATPSTPPPARPTRSGPHPASTARARPIATTPGF